ncbi:MAG: phosphate ABC transporter substrate-binding protein [Anaerolineae bacterium]|jgi:phosphate transport system substrate-binding protein|nr:phosphate ABC transporter substrate-binding protein [Anaerolineae bacterium]MBT7070830.1 phosphate ABC transporter substrate-binding protein [Anaerolineae bacterium]MBT7323712.1 phosphate ABC transporter substrate-binding protein [Anaerolineae bacterium]
MKRILLFTFLLIFLASCSAGGEGAADSQPQTYIENKGSDTIVNLALAWAEQYQTDHPDIRLSVTGGGSGTGIASLVNGTVDIANASRQIKQKEIELASEKGILPVEHIIARDAIAVIVNPENPVTELTLQQISDIYSGVYTNWSEVGGEDRPIVRLSRETNSGTHVYFLETVLRLGDKESTTLFSTNTLLLPSSEGIIVEVRQNPNAIGYDGLGYVPHDLKVIAIAPEVGDDYILPSVETVNSGTYPIARDLYMYTNGEPTGVVAEYLAWIMSAEAQEIVRKLGFVPIN